MADLSISSPGDSDVVANFPADERESRVAMLAALTGAATWGGTSGGSAQVQTATVELTGWALASGVSVDFIAGAANTAAAPTFQVNSTTAKTVLNKDGAALVAGDIKLARQHTVKYDGTSWRLQDPAVTGGITQTIYDALFPVGFVQLKDNETTPAVPSSLTATWTRISTASYLRGATGAPGTGGSLNTSSVAVTINSTSANDGYEDGGEPGMEAHSHTSPTHAHTIEPTYRSFSVWERTA